MPKKIFNNVWFKCISVLLVIAVVLGGLLAILNDVLYVTPEERTGRAIKKIYNQDKEYSIVLDVDNADENINKAIEYDFGKINKVYIVGDSTAQTYDTLFQVTGFNGYKNGTITLWVQVEHGESADVIKKVVLENYDKQTLMGKFNDDYYDTFLVDVTKAYKEGKSFTTESGSDLTNLVSGATYSANAGNNAVNCVIKYLGENNED